MPALVDVGSGGSMSGSSSLASVHVAERGPASASPSSVPPPAYHGGVGMRARMGNRVAYSILFKRDLHPCSRGSCRLLPHLAGHGGRKVGQEGAATVEAGGGIWKPPEIWLPMALSLCRPLHAAAILGHMVCCIALDDDYKVASFFFLNGRISCRASAATKPPPSQVVSSPVGVALPCLRKPPTCFRDLIAFARSFLGC
jgi:hypothetical protein